MTSNSKHLQGLNMSFVLLAFLSIALLIFFPTINAPFLFDDAVNITYNNTIKDLSNFASVSGTNYLGSLTLALNYKFGGLNPAGYHLVNITLHGLNGFLIWLIVKELFKSEKLTATNLNETINGNVVYREFTAAIAAMFFLVHPIQNAAISYSSQRFTVLCTFFYFLALLFYFYSKNSPSAKQKYFLPLSVIFTVAAMLTKEIAFTLPVIIIVTDLLFYNNSKRNIARFLPFLAALLIIPVTLFSSANAGDVSLLNKLDSITRETDLISRGDYFLTQLIAVAIYIKLVVLPFGFNADYDIALRTTFFTPSVILAALVILTVLAGGIFIYRQHKKTNNGHLLLAFYGLVFFFTTLSVQSSIIPVNDLTFEHRVYLPLFGLALTISFLILFAVEKFNKSKFPDSEVFFTSFGLIICLLIILSFYRAVLWSDPERIFSDTVKKSPNKSRVHLNLGLAQEHNGNIKSAVRSYRTSFKIDPSNYHGYNNLARVFAQNGEFEEAVKLLDKSLKIKADESSTYNTLGVIYANLGDFESAVKFFDIALNFDNNNMVALMNSGLGYIKLGNFELASVRFQKALSIDPYNQTAKTALYNLSIHIFGQPN